MIELVYALIVFTSYPTTDAQGRPALGHEWRTVKQFKSVEWMGASGPSAKDQCEHEMYIGAYNPNFYRCVRIK
jgi:hypothetical protein